MTTRITAKTTRDTLEEHYKSDATLLKDAGTLLMFGSLACSGEPLSFLAGMGMIAKAAGSTISAILGISGRLGDPAEKPDSDPLTPYQRFRILFYVTCQRAYLEALNEQMEATLKEKGKSLKKRPTKQKPKSKRKKTRGAHIKQEEAATKSLKKEILMLAANLEDAEVCYLYSISPLDKSQRLFDALSEWLTKTLIYYGVDPFDAHEITERTGKQARERFRVILSQENITSSWMRNYLALALIEETSVIASDLKSIRETLEGWTQQNTVQSQRREEAWNEYREDLRKLPDLKETMFNESFGVRKVFLVPRATYHVRGLPGHAGEPQLVPDLARLLGVLTSMRVTGEDLTILCGGPGSGKSTLCRVLASELAAKPGVHPVFLRLRRMGEGSEIKKFLEQFLQERDIINRIGDLKSVSNLVLILDGFDELVMASRSRLRHFFNVVREDLGTGALSKARVILSGRDTLFPGGEGLPQNAHVISLLPFDKTRVTSWGEKWRNQHSTGHGSKFVPEAFLDDDSKTSSSPNSPLNHLVSWPLTLHLVARVHTRGELNIADNKKDEVEKAYLYRSIVSEASERQDGKGFEKPVLTPEQRRQFLRTLAWEMYVRGTECLEFDHIRPVLRTAHPKMSEQELSEFTESAVLSCPELSKGEETGCEFVHKSFGEYLVAENIAALVERVSYKGTQYASDQIDYTMSLSDAANDLSKVIGIRLIPQEVQEMLEPMLGCLQLFLKGREVNDIVGSSEREKGLLRIIERFEMLYVDFLKGKSLDTINDSTRNKLRIKSPLKAYANYCAGILIVSTAASIQIPPDKSGRRRLVKANPFRGAFWRCMGILMAGEQPIGRDFACRIFPGLSLRESDESAPLTESSMPLKLAYLSSIEGFKSLLEDCLIKILRDAVRRDAWLSALAGRFPRKADSILLHEMSMFFEYPDQTVISYFLHDASGSTEDDAYFALQGSSAESLRILDANEIVHYRRISKSLVSLSEEIREKLDSLSSSEPEERGGGGGFLRNYFPRAFLSRSSLSVSDLEIDVPDSKTQEPGDDKEEQDSE